MKTCKPRQVSTPRKVCQTVVDIYEDVVVTEKCKEVVTTTCTQTTQTATHTAAVVDTSTNLVQAGVPKPPVRRRREAEAVAEAEAKPEPQLGAGTQDQMCTRFGGNLPESCVFRRHGWYKPECGG